MTKYAEIALNLPINRVFHYEVPEELEETLHVGSRVQAPFHNKERQGFCVGFVATPEIPFVRKIQNVLDEDPTADDRLLELTRWISHRYVSSWGEAIFAAIPSGARKKNPGKKLALYRFAAEPEKPLRSEAHTLLLNEMRKIKGAILQSDLLKRHPRSAITALEKKGCLTKEQIAPRIDVLAEVISEKPKVIHLTPEQKAALTTINENSGVVLLHGVTGSGKTEVYLQAIEKAAKEGRQSIVLVPEIALTAQTVARFRSRFPRTAVLHSMLTEAERGAQWRAARRGEVDVIIGARSAIFAPVEKLGIIVIDEEHEPAYKQEQSPRYHVREVAIQRVATEGGTVILGSATPSLESLHRAREKEFRYCELPYRIGSRDLPPIDIVDMAAEVKEVKRLVLLSRKLRQAVEEAVARREQVLLFLNRRGFVTYISCKRCRWVLRCKRCEIALTFHKKESSAICHYCNRNVMVPKICPDCQVGALSQQGAGTEKVEDVVRKLFPSQNLSRMDRDSMKTRQNYREALGGLWSGESDVVIGTQMIAKGLDVPNVTVVGVISADTAFRLPDFRGPERTFQLITQVAGRAGRGPKGGRVIVQSYNPQHFCITTAAKYDWENFVKQELELRRELNYPPFTNLVRILFLGSIEEQVQKTAERFCKKFREKVEELFAQLLGPAPAPIPRIKSRHRIHCLIKTKELKPVLDALREITPGLSRSRAVQVNVDVDPVNML